MQIKGTLIQTAPDTFTTLAVETGLTADGKAGWQIRKLRVFWSLGYTVAAVDHMASCVLATLITSTSLDSHDEICRVSWGQQNTGGVAVTVNLEPIKDHTLSEPRLTVQPIIYIHANTISTGISNRFYFEIDYDLVKLSDLEVLRLLAGGA